MLNYEFPPVGGGASPVTYYLSKELVRQGIDVDVVTTGYNGLKKFEIIDGINVHRVPAIRSKKEICHTHEMLSYDISSLYYVIKLMKKNDYDLNHTHFILPTGLTSYLLKKMKKLPYIITSHGADVPNHNPKFSLQHRLYKTFWHKIMEEAETVISPSTGFKNLIAKNNGFGTKVEIIPHGFNHEQFVPTKKEKTILLVGRLLKIKGIQYFIEAIKGLDTEYEVIIAGDGPYKKILMKNAKKVKPKVRFLGWLNSMVLKRQYERSSIFVLPSSIESFGYVLLEAMSAKNAIITSNLESCLEVVGNTALPVRPKNPQDIEEALLKLINNNELRVQMGENARDRVEKNFTWEKITKKYIKSYDNVINKAG